MRSFFPFRFLFTLLLAGALSSTAAAQDQLRADAPNDWLIQNATVLTVTNGTIENGDILVRDGDIARVGQDLSAPSGVETYDASGEFVMPGIIEAHQHMAISNVNEATNQVTAEVGVGDVLDPYDIGIYRALAGGVTTAHVMHGSANPIGGRNETIKLRYGVTNPDALKMEGAPRTVKFALGENPTGLYGQGRDQVPATRMGVEHVIREALRETKRYMEAKQAYQNGERAQPPAHSERMEILAGVLRGEILVQCHAYLGGHLVGSLIHVADGHVLMGLHDARHHKFAAGVVGLHPAWGREVLAHAGNVAVPHQDVAVLDGPVRDGKNGGVLDQPVVRGIGPKLVLGRRRGRKRTGEQEGEQKSEGEEGAHHNGRARQRACWVTGGRGQLTGLRPPEHSFVRQKPERTGRRARRCLRRSPPQL